MPGDSLRPAANAAAFLTAAASSPEEWLAALSVVGDRGIDAAGESRPLAGWAAAWQASANANLAFAGRSLAWWAAQRQEGEGEWNLEWTQQVVVPPTLSGKPEFRPTLFVGARPAARK
jgi:hypothetical protein